MKYLLTIVLLVVILATGCSNNGLFVGLNQTNVELSGANYQMVATNLMGKSEAAYILGMSMSMGAATQTFAVARISGSGMLYKEALEDLWRQFEAQHGKAEGRKLALANVRYDSETLNLFLFTTVKIYIRADIIEFTH